MKNEGFLFLVHSFGEGGAPASEMKEIALKLCFYGET